MKVSPLLEQYRVLNGMLRSNPGDLGGFFAVPGPAGEQLAICASPASVEAGVLWEHVSVSMRHRCPHWGEMCFVKDLFWDEEEPVMQLHPPKSTWVNNHKFCLHLWRPVEEKIPIPPEILVGWKDLGVLYDGRKKPCLPAQHS